MTNSICEPVQEHFDPYHVWLGIPPHKQPPDHYRLLGIEPFESSPAVIENAAAQRMSHLRCYQNGRHGARSQELLNEVAAAKLFLLQPEKKAFYDEYLQQCQAVNNLRDSYQTPATPGKRNNVIVSGASSVAAVRQLRAARKRRQTLQMVAINLLGLGLVGMMTFFIWQTRPEAMPPNVRRSQPKASLHDLVWPEVVQAPSAPSGPRPSTNQRIKTAGGPSQNPAPPVPPPAAKVLKPVVARENPADKKASSPTVGTIHAAGSSPAADRRRQPLGDRL